MFRKLLSNTILLLIVLISLTACGASKDSGGLAVDLLFLDFYESLGGADVLGIAISPKFNQDNIIYQYTTGALMTYDARFPLTQRYALAPIGIKMSLSEAPSDIDLPGGHAVHPEFQSVYEKIGELYFTGLPLTAGHYNPELGRIEQYFENVGFYHLDKDAPGEVHLLQYGAWLCAASCDYRSPKNAMPVSNSSAEHSTSSDVDHSAAEIPDPSDNVSPSQEIPTSESVDITLTTWKDQASITSEEQQIISVAVYDGELQPITDLEPIMMLTVPMRDGGAQLFVFTFALTNANDGISSLTLDPIDAPDGTQINYQICPWNGAHESLCVRDKFLIWGGQ